MKKRLTKYSTNQVVFAVRGGRGEYFDIDPVVLPVIVVFLSFFGAGSTSPSYIILALVMSEGIGTNTQHTSHEKKQDWRDVFKQHQTTHSRGKSERKPAQNVEEDDWSDF